MAAVIAALTCITLTAAAATAGEFYASLLRRGVAAFDAGRYDEATRHLRLAAFGFIENIEQYQTAHAYLAATYEKSGQPDRARDSVRRIAQAQRVAPRFATLQLPNPVRTTVEKIAAGVLTPAELSGLRGTAAMPPAPPPQRPAVTTTTTTTTTDPPATVDKIDVEIVKPPQTQNGSNGTQPTSTTKPAATTAKPPAVTTTPARPQPNPPATATGSTNPPATATPVRPPVTIPATTTPARPAPAVTYTAAERAARFAAAERALVASNLVEARRVYSELLASAGLDHASYIRIAEGFYRARDFANTLAAFDRAGALRSGEEPYRYYVAVALYETGQYARAKRELAFVLPYIEITPDVARYRAKIQSAVQ